MPGNHGPPLRSGSSWRRPAAAAWRRRCDGAPANTTSPPARPSKSGGRLAGRNVMHSCSVSWQSADRLAGDSSPLRGELQQCSHTINREVRVAQMARRSDDDEILGRCGRRLGSEAAEARVTLEVNWQPQRFKLSAALASLLGVHSDTRTRILQAGAQILFTKFWDRVFDQLILGSVARLIELGVPLGPACCSAISAPFAKPSTAIMCCLSATHAPAPAAELSMRACAGGVRIHHAAKASGRSPAWHRALRRAAEGCAG